MNLISNISIHLRKVIYIFAFFLIILFGGTFGYMLFENTKFWDGMYLTIITVFTVGYGDMVPIHPAGKIFTVLLVCAGVSFVMYSFSKITETMVEGELKSFFVRRKMNKQVARLRNHYIVCGFGRIGMEICSILQENNRPFVVIERDEDAVKEIGRLGYIELVGDASDDDILLAAGIERARGLIAVVGTDADNLYITLTARGLNHDLFIMARSSGVRGVVRKLKRAGASRVISPYSIGARRMAQLIIRPTVMDFIDLAMHADELGLFMEEFVVSDKAHFAGKRLIDSGLRKKYNVIVIAIKRGDEPMIFNPKANVFILAGDILIVLGDSDNIAALEKVI